MASPYDYLIGAAVYGPEDETPEMIRAVHDVRVDPRFAGWSEGTTWIVELTCRHTGEGFVRIEDILSERFAINPTPAALRALRRWHGRVMGDLDGPIPF